RRRRRGHRAVGRRQVALGSLPRQQSRARGLERRDVEPARRIIGAPKNSREVPMKRFVVVTPILFCFLAFAPGAFAQAAKAAPATAQAAPSSSQEVVKARMSTPVKGTAYVEVIQGQAKKVGGDMVTVTRIKNVS